MSVQPAPKKWIRPVLAVSLAAGLVVVGGVVLVVYLFTTSMDDKLKDLKSADRRTSTGALEWLAEADVNDAQRATVTAALEPSLFDGDIHGNLNPDLALRVYLAWADKNNVPAMVRMVENPTLPSWNARQSGLVMEALARIGDDRAIEALARKLPDAALHDQAVNGLKVMGPKAEGAVLDYLFDPDSATRIRASQLLDDYRTKDSAIAATALRALKSSNADVRNSAVVWFIDNKPSDDSGQAAAGKALVKLLADPSAKARDQALKALVRWGSKDCLPELLEYARSKQASAKGNPLLIEVLAQIPDETAADAIAMQLPNAQTRGRAVKALLKLGPAAQKVVIRYLDYPDAGVQRDVRELCRLLNIPPDRQLPQVLADIAGTDIPRARVALQYLAELRPDQANRAKVSKALNAPLMDADKDVRADALAAVKIWGSTENTATLLKVLGAFHAGGPARNVHVIAALGTIKDVKAAPTLAQGLADGRERAMAGKALIAIGSGAEAAVLPFLQAPDRGTRLEACLVLGEIGTSKSVRPLRDSISQHFTDGEFAREAERAIQKITARK